MADYTIKMDEEIEAQFAVVILAMELAAEFASVGERVGKALPDLPLPPSDIVVKYGTGRHRQVSSKFGQYCANYSLVLMISGCEQYLRQLTLFSRIAAEIARSRGPIRGDRFEQIRQDVARDKSPLWRVFSELLKTLGRKRQTIYGRTWFTSLERIRNCLVHRAGVVGDADIPKKAVFEAIWPKTTITDPDGRLVTSLPFRTEKGGEYRITATPQKRVWQKGERIAISAQDCHDMAFSLAQFCDQVRIQVHAGLEDLLLGAA